MSSLQSHLVFEYIYLFCWVFEWTDMVLKKAFEQYSAVFEKLMS